MPHIYTGHPAFLPAIPSPRQTTMKSAELQLGEALPLQERTGLRDSLGLRFIAATTLCLLVVFAGVLLRDIQLVERAIVEPFHLRVESLKPVLDAALSDPLVNGDHRELAERLEQARSDDDIVYLVVRDADDRPVAAVGREPAAPLPLASKRVLDDSGVYHTFMLIEAGGRKYGTLNLGISTARLTAYRDEVLWRGFAMLAFGVVVVGGIGAWLAVRLTRRLRALTAASESVARGQYDLALPQEGNDEVARLAASMNSMRIALSDRIRLLEESETRLRLAIEAGSVVAWERDLQRDRLNWGPGVERVLGPLPPGEVHYPDLLTMVHDEDGNSSRLRASWRFRAAQSIGAMYESPAWMAASAGRPFAASSSAMPQPARRG